MKSSIHQKQNFAVFSSKIVALDFKDIDTDMIIPAEFLKTTTREGLGKHLFTNFREKNPNFLINENQSIMVVGANFGCGSSREHAVWALQDAGIQAIVSSKFADIFRGNAEKNNLLLITLSEKNIREILAESTSLTIDLQNQKIISDKNVIYDFEISNFLKKKFLEQLSDLDYLVDKKEKIQQFEK